MDCLGEEKGGFVELSFIMFWGVTESSSYILKSR